MVRVLLICGVVAAAAVNIALADEDPLVVLGKKLFFDQRLSSDGKVSCAKCHVPDQAFSDGLPTAKGANERITTRNTPSLLDVADHGQPFWDGRKPSLQEQALEPFFNAAEHGLKGFDDLKARIMEDSAYKKAFQRAFPAEHDVSREQIASALTAYERTLRSEANRVDRYLVGEAGALSGSERRGLELFRGRAQCIECHLMQSPRPTFTDNGFHGLGVATSLGSELAALSMEVAAAKAEVVPVMITTRSEIASLGRFVVTRDPRDIAKFKTPSLRNVAITGPYMHDGSVKTLDEAVEREIYYRSHSRGGPVVLTPQEKGDLTSFLRALTGSTDSQPK